MEVLDLRDPISAACGIDLEIRDTGFVDRTTADRGDREFSATLLAMAGHDLRQPLQILTGAHDGLARLVDGEPQHEGLAWAEDATTQLTVILGQLIEALYRRRPSYDGLVAPVPLRPILESLAAEFDNAAWLKGLTFLVAAPRGAVFSHPVLLTGMLRNLIRNAIHGTPPGGGVFITAQQRGAKTCIAVRDTGMGLPADALTMMFNDGTHGEARSDGLDLGLFIVRHAAELLGHSVEINAAQGRGSCFTIVADAA